jgi:hypothetical protein
MQTLLTIASLIVAASVALIGFQQYRLASAQFKLELFDRRYAIYKATQKYLSIILREAHVDYSDSVQFLSETQDALFLFGPDVAKYLESIYKQGIELCSTAHQFEPLPVGTERSRIVEKNADLLSKLTSELTRLKKVFEPYLTFRHWS